MRHPLALNPMFRCPFADWGNLGSIILLNFGFTSNKCLLLFMNGRQMKRLGIFFQIHYATHLWERVAGQAAILEIVARWFLGVVGLDP